MHHLASRLTPRFRVVVLAPHAAGAKFEEVIDGVEVRRFRYAPSRLETLVNDGGIVQNLRKHRWKMLLVPTFVLSELLATLRLIRSLRPSVIHAHWFVPQGVVAALARRLSSASPPFLLTSHGADLFALRGGAWSRARQWIVGQAEAVTVVSSAMREMLEGEGVEAARVHVEPMGVDLETRFTPSLEAAPADTLLFVGRLVRKKGLHVLLDALPVVLATRPHVTLVVVGFGPELGDLQAQASRLGLGRVVRFLGASGQAELPAHYRRAKVFVAPFVEAPGGDQEGLGLVVVEAIGCGCRVVVSDLVGTRDFVPVPGAVARVAPGDPATLALAILDMLAAEPPTGRPDVERFDWRSRARAYGDMLEATSRADSPRRV